MIPRTAVLRDGTRMRLRRPKPSDAQAIGRLMKEIAAERVHFVVENFRFDVREERAWLRRQRGNKGCVVVAATWQGEIVGVLTAIRGRREKTRHTAEVETIGVRRDWRGKGLGRELMLEAIDWARRPRVKKLWLGTFSTNRRALRLYASLGFQREGVMRRHYKIGGRLVDGVHLARWL